MLASVPGKGLLVATLILSTILLLSVQFSSPPRANSSKDDTPQPETDDYATAAAAARGGGVFSSSSQTPNNNAEEALSLSPDTTFHRSPSDELAGPTSSTVLPPSPDSSSSSKKNIAPYRVRDSHVFEVLQNAASDPPAYYAAGNLRSHNNGGPQLSSNDASSALPFLFVFHPSIQRVFIEVGTNRQPELCMLLPKYPDAILLGFEPQPKVFPQTLNSMKNFPAHQSMIFPAAISPKEGTVEMSVAAHTGCASLLQMNDKAREFAKQQRKKSPRSGSASFQLRTLERCAQSKHRPKNVATFPLSVILHLIPSSLTIDVVMIDAQGYDLVVASTIGVARHSPRIRYLILECQDLPIGHPLFLVAGAPNCHLQRSCVERALIHHKLAFCWENSAVSRELNCLYRRRTSSSSPSSQPIRPSTSEGAAAKKVGGAENEEGEEDEDPYLMALQKELSWRPRRNITVVNRPPAEEYQCPEFQQ